jgi:hypothetical protein
MRAIMPWAAKRQVVCCHRGQPHLICVEGQSTYGFWRLNRVHLTVHGAPMRPGSGVAGGGQGGGGQGGRANLPSWLN